MKPKTIIFEATEAYNSERRGIGVQMRTWLELAPFVQFPQIQFLIVRRALDHSEQLHTDAPNVRQLTRATDTEEAYIDYLYSLNSDVLFFPLADKKYIRNSLARKVGADYGMEDFYCRNYTARRSVASLLDGHAYALQHFTEVVTVSETSKRDLAWFFPEFKDKIHVVYPGSAAAPADSEGELAGTIQGSRYFFVVGYEHKKNIIRIAQAFDAFKRQSKSSAKLVIAGKPGYGAAEIDAYIATLACERDIIRLGYVGDSQKQLLLQRSHAVVALPIYEGFGLSALEGLQSGKIVLVSDNGSLAEIVADAGYLADPFSVASMAEQFGHIDALRSNPKASLIQGRLAIFEPSVQAERLLHRLIRLCEV